MRSKEAAQTRLNQNPQAMRVRRETVEHPFGTLKMRMGATHFLMKTLPKVATEMALHVLAYNLTRVKIFCSGGFALKWRGELRGR
jgi:Transposase DDE domain